MTTDSSYNESHLSEDGDREVTSVARRVSTKERVAVQTATQIRWRECGTLLDHGRSRT